MMNTGFGVAGRPAARLASSSELPHELPRYHGGASPPVRFAR
jgi:hypothetical protein